LEFKLQLVRVPARNTPTCPAVVPLCGTKAEVTVPSLDDWEKESEKFTTQRATKVVAGGFPAAAGRHRAIKLARGSGSGLGKYYKTRNRPVHACCIGLQFSAFGRSGRTDSQGGTSL